MDGDGAGLGWDVWKRRSDGDLIETAESVVLDFSCELRALSAYGVARPRRRHARVQPPGTKAGTPKERPPAPPRPRRPWPASRSCCSPFRPGILSKITKHIEWMWQLNPLGETSALFPPKNSSFSNEQWLRRSMPEREWDRETIKGRPRDLAPFSLHLNKVGSFWSTCIMLLHSHFYYYYYFYNQIKSIILIPQGPNLLYCNFHSID